MSTVIGNVLSIYKADVSDHKRKLKELKGAEKQRQLELIKGIEDGNKSLDSQIAKWGKMTAAVGVTVGALKGLAASFDSYARRMELRTATVGINIGKLQQAFGGLVTQTETMQFAASALNGDFRHTQEEMELLAKWANILRKQGNMTADVFKGVLQAAVEGNIEPMKKFGVATKAASGTVEAHHAMLLEATNAVIKYGDEGEIAGDKTKQAMIKNKDAWALFKDEMGKLYVQLTPVIRQFAEMVKSLAFMAKYTGDVVNYVKKLSPAYWYGRAAGGIYGNVATDDIDPGEGQIQRNNMWGAWQRSLADKERLRQQAKDRARNLAVLGLLNDYGPKWDTVKDYKPPKYVEEKLNIKELTKEQLAHAAWLAKYTEIVQANPWGAVLGLPDYGYTQKLKGGLTLDATRFREFKSSLPPKVMQELMQELLPLGQRYVNESWKGYTRSSLGLAPIGAKTDDPLNEFGLGGLLAGVDQKQLSKLSDDASFRYGGTFDLLKQQGEGAQQRFASASAQAFSQIITGAKSAGEAVRQAFGQMIMAQSMDLFAKGISQGVQALIHLVSGDPVRAIGAGKASATAFAGAATLGAMAAALGVGNKLPGKPAGLGAGGGAGAGLAVPGSQGSNTVILMGDDFTSRSRRSQAADLEQLLQLAQSNSGHNVVRAG